MSTLQTLSHHASDLTVAPTNACCPWRNASRLFFSGCILGLAAVLALPVDRAVAQWFEDHRLPGELGRLIRLAEIFGWGGGAAIIVFTAAKLDPRGWRIAIPLSIQSLGAGLAADVVKLFIARTRPLATHSAATVSETFVAAMPLLNTGALENGYGHHLQSFPSAHAATAVGLAIALSTIYPRGRGLFAIFASLAMVQRLEAHAHYLSDVLAGAAVAFFVAAVYTRVFQQQSRGYNLVGVVALPGESPGADLPPAER